jgi:hypothetical protein
MSCDADSEWDHRPIYNRDPIFTPTDGENEQCAQAQAAVSSDGRLVVEDRRAHIVRVAEVSPSRRLAHMVLKTGSSASWTRIASSTASMSPGESRPSRVVSRRLLAVVS